ncbi:MULTISPECIES: hypothetical protein [Chromobacterium]|uniref:hypothetical protein n=1 Tax=Chromobacterium TaxID=535 RepID=UPI0018893DB7|nr:MULTISPECIES: hypothetical protein [Chromobacterium]WON85562.1 hypothetical protein OK026_08755 [Chromobacterium haemolyticum]
MRRSAGRGSMLRAAVGIAGSMAALRASLVIAAGAWAATFMSTSAGAAASAVMSSSAGTAASAVMSTSAGTAAATFMSTSAGTSASAVMSTATCLAEQRAVWRREGQGRRGQRT